MKTSLIVFFFYCLVISSSQASDDSLQLVEFNSRIYKIRLSENNLVPLRVSSSTQFEKSASYIFLELAKFWEHQNILGVDGQRIARYLKKEDPKKWKDLTKKHFICMNSIAKNTCKEFLELKYKYDTLSFHYNQL